MMNSWITKQTLHISRHNECTKYKVVSENSKDAIQLFGYQVKWFGNPNSRLSLFLGCRNFYNSHMVKFS